MQTLKLSAAILFGVLTLLGTIALIASNAPQDDEALIVQAACAVLFFCFLHAWHRGKRRQYRGMRTGQG